MNSMRCGFAASLNETAEMSVATLRTRNDVYDMIMSFVDLLSGNLPCGIALPGDR
jgi:hypothetical protein